MANVRIVTPPAFKKPSERDPSELPECLARLQKFLLDQVEYDCRNFAEAIAEWRDNNLWQHFNPSWQEFVAEHIKQPLDWIDHVIQGVNILDNSKPVKAQDAIAASKQRAIALAENPKPLNTNGGDRISNKQYYYNNTATPSRQGTDPEYLASKLAKDHPDVLGKVKSGEYPSVRAAAVDAGILKPRQQFTVGHSTTPEAFARSLTDKLDPDFLAQVVVAIESRLTGAG